LQNSLAKDSEELTEFVKAGRRKGENMKVAAYLNSGRLQERLPLLDDRLFRKLQRKGVVTGKMISCRQVASPKFKGLAMEFKNGTAKFSFLASFERWDIAAIVRQLGSEETDDWLGHQVRFIIRKGQKGGTFVNVENPKKAPQ
jgi:hypothetical protein